MMREPPLATSAGFTASGMAAGFGPTGRSLSQAPRRATLASTSEERRSPRRSQESSEAYIIGFLGSIGQPARRSRLCARRARVGDANQLARINRLTLNRSSPSHSAAVISRDGRKVLYESTTTFGAWLPYHVRRVSRGQSR